MNNNLLFPVDAPGSRILWNMEENLRLYKLWHDSFYQWVFAVFERKVVFLRNVDREVGFLVC